VQGDGKYPNLMSLTATSSGSGASTNILVQAAPNSRWYANVPLDFTNNMQLILTAENGALTVTQQLSWATTSVLNGGTLLIRKGDSLLLNAAPAGAITGSVTVTVSGTPHTTTPANPVPIAFTNAGNFTVTGVYTAGTNVLSNAVVVKVLDYSFPQNPGVWVNHARTWDVPTFSTNIVLDLAANLTCAEVASPTNTLRRFSLNVAQQGDHLVAARLGQAGPVLTTAQVKGFQVWSLGDTYTMYVATYANGDRLVETLIVVSPELPVGVTIQLHIFVAGVTFEDGTIDKALTVADFDALGRYKVRFNYPKGTQSSVCHTMSVKQGNVVLGTR
jgi:hypothetical protein